MNDDGGKTHLSADAPRQLDAELRGRDEDRWLATRYGAPEVRRKLVALYAFAAELMRIPSAVSEPPLGEIRLQWFRDAFQEIRDGARVRQHPIVLEVEANRLADAHYQSLIDTAIDAAARPLYGEGFSDVDDCLDWCTDAFGAIDALAARLAGAGKDIEAQVTAASGAYGAARIAPSLPETLSAEIGKEAIARYGDAKAALKNAPLEASVHLFLTPLYVHAEGRPFGLKKRARMFTAAILGR